MSTCLTKTSPSTVAVTVLDTVSAALTGSAGGPVSRIALMPGLEIAWDDCQCGTLALAVTNRYTSRNFPITAQDLPVNCCNLYLVYEYALVIVRCVPGETTDARPPKVAALASAFDVQESDAFVLRTQTECALASLYTPTGSETIAAYVVNDQPSLGPQGGCAGSQLNFKVAFSYPCGCGHG